MRLFAYFTNFVLLGCFLGMGTGVLLAKRKANFIEIFPFLLLATIIAVRCFRLEVSIGSTDTVYFTNPAQGAERQVEYFFLLIYNFFREPWLVSKLAAMVREAVGEESLVRVFSGENLFALVAAGPRLPRPGFQARRRSPRPPESLPRPTTGLSSTCAPLPCPATTPRLSSSPSSSTACRSCFSSRRFDQDRRMTRLRTLSLF